MGMKRFMLSITEDMERALEKERKRRMLGSIPETAGWSWANTWQHKKQFRVKCPSVQVEPGDKRLNSLSLHRLSLP